MNVQIKSMAGENDSLYVSVRGISFMLILMEGEIWEEQEEDRCERYGEGGRIVTIVKQE